MDWSWAKNLFSSIINLLPQSPLKSVTNLINDIPYLSWLNWFFPVSECLTLMVGWLLCIAVYYGLSAILRWIKLVS